MVTCLFTYLNLPLIRPKAGAAQLCRTACQGFHCNEDKIHCTSILPLNSYNNNRLKQNKTITSTLVFVLPSLFLKAAIYCTISHLTLDQTSFREIDGWSDERFSIQNCPITRWKLRVWFDTRFCLVHLPNILLISGRYRSSSQSGGHPL